MEPGDRRLAVHSHPQAGVAGLPHLDLRRGVRGTLRPGSRAYLLPSPDAPQGRIHQEDFNQALGATGNQKYQKYGSKVSLARIARVFTATGDSRSLERLFKLIVVSVAVGNLDMHAKNISLLHRPDGSITLSPAYDVVPQAHQPNDGEVALAVARSAKLS
jgi:hypothetical protein